MIKGRVYQISLKSTDKIYIGSTTLPLLARFSQHNSAFADAAQKCASYEILRYDDAEIDLLEEVEVDDIMELHEIEQFYIDNLPNVCNKNAAILPGELCAIGRPLGNKTKEQRKIERANYMKTYYATHKDKMKQNAQRAHQRQQQMAHAAKQAGIIVN
jgi:hypothetical protein